MAVEAVANPLQLGEKIDLVDQKIEGFSFFPLVGLADSKLHQAVRKRPVLEDAAASFHVDIPLSVGGAPTRQIVDESMQVFDRIAFGAQLHREAEAAALPAFRFRPQNPLEVPLFDLDVDLPPIGFRGSGFKSHGCRHQRHVVGSWIFVAQAHRSFTSRYRQAARSGGPMIGSA